MEIAFLDDYYQRGSIMQCPTIVVERITHPDMTVSYDVYLEHAGKEIRGYSLLNNVETAFQHEPELNALSQRIFGVSPTICNKTDEWPVWLTPSQER